MSFCFLICRGSTVEIRQRQKIKISSYNIISILSLQATATNIDRHKENQDRITHTTNEKECENWGMLHFYIALFVFNITMEADFPACFYFSVLSKMLQFFV